MISVTKIFRFETAHAILNYPGKCAQIHGHSYELHVSIRLKDLVEEHLEGLGMVLDFKELKAIVQKDVIEILDHKMVLSKNYVAENKINIPSDELLAVDWEPTAENLLLFIRGRLHNAFADDAQLHSLKLWETRDSYAEWSAG